MAIVARASRRGSVHIIEPHPLAALWLSAVLRPEPGFEVMISQGRPQPGHERRPCVWIIDGDALSLPLTAYLLSIPRSREVSILMLGSQLVEAEVCRLIPVGVRGFVAYEHAQGQIRPAVGAVLQGRLWFPSRVLEHYAIWSSAGNHNSGGCELSSREQEVADLVRRGLSNKEIGGALGIGERTVRFHLHNIFEKLGVHDRYRLAEYARTISAGGASANATACK